MPITQPEVGALQERVDANIVKMHQAHIRMSPKLAKIGAEMAIAVIEGRTEKSTRLAGHFLKQLEDMAKEG